MPGRRHIALAGLTLGVMLGGAACSESPSSETQPDRTMVPGHDPLADAPQAWPEFLAWAGSELAKLPPAVPLPAEMVLPEPKWPVLRLDEKLGRATVRCEWQPAETATGTLAALGPFHSALPEPNLTVEAKTGGLEPGVLMTIRGFRVQREQVGSVAVELRQPCGEHFELRWSRAGRIRVPIPDNQRFWTLNIATDGFAEWAGPLTSISLRTDGIGEEPVEIRAIRFLSRGDSFPQPADVRRVVLEGETRSALYMHCPSEVQFPAVKLPRAAKLQFGIGLVAASSGQSAGAPGQVRLEVLVEHAGRPTSVWSGPTSPAPGWSDQAVPLDNWAGETVSLILRATGPTGAAVACWGNPVVYPPADNPPRVIIYLIDAVAAGHVNLYGYHRPTMPRLSALAQQGVWFAKAFANSPRTVESVADIMLSLPTEAHGVYHPSATAPEELVALPEVLRAAGFATACFSTNVNAGPRQNVDQGFDHFFDRIAYWWTGQADRTVPIEDVMTWLQVHHDRPTFIYIHTAEPHAPYTPPQGFAGRFDPDYEGSIDGTYHAEHGFRKLKAQRDLAHVVALYDEEIAYADARLGRFLDTLATAGLLADTHIFVTADHGEQFLQHDSWEHGNDLHNELMNIPLVAVGPRFSSRGREPTPVQLYDLMPTILDMFDLPGPYPLAGHSLLPRLTGARDKDPLGHRVIIASNHSYRGRGIIQYAVVEGGRWKLMHQYPARPAEGGRRFERFGLFDLQADPGELHDVMDARPGVARRLIGHLVEWHRRYAPFEAREPSDRLMLDANQLEELRSLGYIE